MTATFAAGEDITATKLNQINTTLTAYKTVDEPLNTNASVQDDDHLFVAVEASKTYAVYGRLWWTSTSQTPDIRVGFSGPTGATMTHSLIGQPTSATSGTGTVDTGVATAIGTEHTRGTINGDLTGFLVGTLVVSTTAGTFRLRWSQATSDAANVTLKAGSWIVLVALN